MKSYWPTSFLVAVLLLSVACAEQKPKVAAAPVAPTPQPDPPAQIFAQTNLELPDPQPVPPDAIVKPQPPAQPAVTGTAPAHAAPKRPLAAKRDSEAAESSPVIPEPTKPAGRTPLVAVDPDLPRSDIIQKRLDAVKAMHDRLSAAKGAGTGGNAEMTRSRIQFFIEQAEKALARKDLRQADSLTGRAELLAQDLLRVR